MAKVNTTADEILIREGKVARFFAVSIGGRWPFKSWLDGLEKRQSAKVYASMDMIDAALAQRRPIGRLEKLGEVWELKFTKPGAKPPHLRGLAAREGNDFYLVIGLTKQTNRIPTRKIKLAESRVKAWRQTK